MSGGVDQVEFIVFAVLGGVTHADRVRLDGDPAFPFQIHAVQQLFLQIPLCNSVGVFQQAVRQCGFPVVNMSDNTKIANMFKIHDAPAEIPFKKITYFI